MSDNSNQPINIGELIKENNNIKYNITTKLESDLPRFKVNIESYLNFQIKIIKDLQDEPYLQVFTETEKLAKLFYIPIYLRKKEFEIQNSFKYGSLSFYFTHMGNIYYRISYPTQTENQLNFIESELIIDNKSSSNHELNSMMIDFLSKMNKWEQETSKENIIYIDLE